MKYGQTAQHGRTITVQSELRWTTTARIHGIPYSIPVNHRGTTTQSAQVVTNHNQKELEAFSTCSSFLPCKYCFVRDLVMATSISSYIHRMKLTPILF